MLALAPLSVAPYLFPRPFAPIAEPTLADIVRYEQTGGARATASANEYLPAWVRDPDPPAVLAPAYLAGATPERLDRAALPAGSEATLLAAAPLADAYRLTLPIAGQARFLRFYFPGWRAAVDGEPVAIEPDPRYGLIQVPCPRARTRCGSASAQRRRATARLAAGGAGVGRSGAGVCGVAPPPTRRGRAAVETAGSSR